MSTYVGGTRFSALLALFSLVVICLLSRIDVQQVKKVRISKSTSTRVTPTLEFVIIVSRHGNRGPIFTYPSFPYPHNDTTFWPNGVVELTEHGKFQMYQLGAKIRSMYGGFLNQNYYKKDFKAFSTVVDRTMMSASAFLAGLFPPQGFQVWNSQLPWQPVPVFPTFLDHTKIVPPGLPVCPRFKEAQNESLAEFERTLGPNITALLSSLHPSGVQTPPWPSHLALTVLWDNLLCSDEEGLTLPVWAKTVYPEPIATLMSKLSKTLMRTSEIMIRLVQGQLFQEIVGLMKSKATGELNPDQKMYYYSGHDFTLYGLKSILGMRDSDMVVVKSGSALIIELHQDPQSKKHYVQVLYQDGGSTDLEPQTLTIPQCEEPCELEQLMDLTHKYYNITDYEKECQSSKIV